MSFFSSRLSQKVKWLTSSRFVRKAVRLIALLTIVLITSVVVLVLLVWTGVFGPIPDKEELKNIKHPLASEVYSADSVLLGRYFLQERSPVSDAEMPKSLKQALIATEDVRFYQHHGIDTKSLFRVLVKTILFQNESSGGGSTITQQLAKNLYPRQHHVFLSLPIDQPLNF